MMPGQGIARRSVAAYVAPFVLFIVPTMFESSGWFGINYETICTLKGILVAVALWGFRRYYPPVSTVGFGLAIVAGALGCVLWIVLDRLQTAIPGMHYLMTTVLQRSEER